MDLRQAGHTEHDTPPPGESAAYPDVASVLSPERSGDGMFLANMSHEIRTPMNTILGYAQILSREAELNDTHQQNLDAIIMSARHLLTLINDVLDISKIEAGRMEVVTSVFDVHAMIRSVETIARSRISKGSIELHVNVDPKVPKYIMADESKLRQIVVNLVSNAIKYTGEGLVYLQVSLAAEDVLKVRVCDTGPGISPEQLERVFQPFERGGIEEDSQEGTGLGLAISRQFANLMRGSLTAASVVGEGSDFELQLPFQLAYSEDAEDGGHNVRVVGIRGRSRRVLIVDDHQENATLASQFLQSIGFDVEVVYDGLTAIEKCRESAPDVVLMDKRMPGMDGLEATQRIRELPVCSGVMVIVVTACVHQEDKDELMDSCADGYVRKPYLEEELLQEIARTSGVQYRYEFVEPVFVQGETSVAGLQCTAAEQRELVSATLAGDFEALLGLVEALDVDDASKRYLKSLVRQYRYEDLLDLVDKTTGS